MTAWPESYTSYPLIGVGAIVSKNGRAWTVWALCKAIDDGSGKVTRKKLREFMNHLTISDRQQRRWIAAAKSIGLVKEGLSKGVEYYWHINPAAAAIKVQAAGIGAPREMRTKDLAVKGWHKYIWAAYLATLDGRPVSQKKKQELTGASPRLQRKWQQPDQDRVSLSYPTFNYADTAIRPDQIEGMQEVNGWHCIVNGENEQVKQRLPNGRVVHGSISKPIGIGERTRKIRRIFEESLQLLGIIHPADQANASRGRQFCRNKRHAKKVVKKLMNVFPDDRPQDIFERVGQRGRVYNYVTVSV